MRSSVKAKWVAALRHYDGSRCPSRLRYHDAFCPLGVLALLYTQVKKVPWPIKWSAWGEGLPPEVQKWARLTEADPWLFGARITTRYDAQQQTHYTIAKLIEESSL